MGYTKETGTEENQKIVRMGSNHKGRLRFWASAHENFLWYLGISGKILFGVSGPQSGSKFLVSRPLSTSKQEILGIWASGRSQNLRPKRPTDSLVSDPGDPLPVSTRGRPRDPAIRHPCRRKRLTTQRPKIPSAAPPADRGDPETRSDPSVPARLKETRIPSPLGSETRTAWRESQRPTAAHSPAGSAGRLQKVGQGILY